MRIARALLDELVEHALAEAPLECCGLIVGDEYGASHVIPIANAAESATRFELDGAEHWQALRNLDGEDVWVLAVYHSHTLAPAEPSRSDVDLCADRSLLQLIVGVQSPDWPEVRAWRYGGDGSVAEAPLDVFAAPPLKAMRTTFMASADYPPG